MKKYILCSSFHWGKKKKRREEKRSEISLGHGTQPPLLPSPTSPSLLHSTLLPNSGKFLVLLFTCQVSSYLLFSPGPCLVRPRATGSIHVGNPSSGEFTSLYRHLSSPGRSETHSDSGHLREDQGFVFSFPFFFYLLCLGALPSLCPSPRWFGRLTLIGNSQSDTAGNRLYNAGKDHLCGKKKER